MWLFHNPGILGINARNLHYIRAYNPEKAIMMADSKLFTKQFLSARGVPVAKLFGVIRNKKELEEFNWNALPESFVIKPNSGYGGEGILIIGKHDGDKWYTTDEENLPLGELKRHVSDILDGRYSIADIADLALFEQKLEAPEFLAKMSYKGLPDIRIIVHNLIPVMAMLRLPTRASGGKANLHMGGIGVGIDIAKGELTHITQYNHIIKALPDFGDVKGVKIPDWKDLLLIASRVQQVTNLGFAAIDLAIDKNVGPVLLEINARAGLSVQIANLAPLRRRLERIEGIKVGTPEKGVRIAQDIFGEKKEAKAITPSAKTVVGNFEQVEIIGKEGNLKIMARMDPYGEKSLLDADVAEKIGLEPEGKCKLNLMEKRMTTVVEMADFSGEKFKMVIGKRDLRDFWIDPSKPNAMAEKKPMASHSAEPPSEEKIQAIDRELFEIDSEIHLLSHLRPLNLKEECDKFLKDTDYNPQFEYKPVSFSADVFLERLSHLDFPDDPMGILLKKKSEEIKLKMELIKARGSDKFTACATALIPPPDEGMLKEARQEAEKMPKAFPEEKASMNAEQVRKFLEKNLSQAEIGNWSVALKEDLVADVVVGKNNTLLVKTGVVFTEKRLKGIVAHEIETHIFRAMNGARQPYGIFQRGFAGYLLTEEGLAIYNQEQTGAIETEKKYWPASSVIGIHAAMTGGFADVYDALLEYGFTPARALKVAIKAKRGLKDTRRKGAFTKDAVYFAGLKKIHAFIQDGGGLRDLYLGKINLDDLAVIKKIKGLKQPYYLPAYLKTEQ